jgi:hypothetical protein
VSGASTINDNLVNDSGGSIHFAGPTTDTLNGSMNNNGAFTVDAGAGAIIDGPYTGSGTITNNGTIQFVIV